MGINKIINFCLIILCCCVLLHAGTQAPASTPPAYHGVPITKVVIFDIGGVLASYSTSSASMIVFKAVVQEVGFFKVVKYALSQKKLNQRLRALVFKVLEEVGNRSGRSPESLKFHTTCDEQGNPHPTGLGLLHGGSISSPEFVARACAIIDEWWFADKNLCKDVRQHFRSYTEACFVRAAIKLMGDGERIATIFKPIKEGIRLLEKLSTTPGIAVMILSNYPTDQFEAFLAQPFMKKAFAHVPREQIFCSGQELPNVSYNGRYGGKHFLPVKPNGFAFFKMAHYCLTTWGVQPKNIFFIDNQKENVQAACEQGMKGLLVNSKNAGHEIYNHDFKELAQVIEKEVLSKNSDGFSYGTASLNDIVQIVIEREA